MRLLLIDLDDTILNTASFGKLLFKNLADATHLHPDVLSLLYKSIKDKNGVKDWTPFIKSLEEIYHIDPEVFYNAFDTSLLSVKPNEEALEILRNFEGFKVLFSYGDPDSQVRKIDALKINSYLDDIWITTQDKFLSLSRKIRNQKFLYKDKKYEEVTVVDNSLQFLEEVKKEYPWIQVIEAK